MLPTCPMPEAMGASAVTYSLDGPSTISAGREKRLIFLKTFVYADERPPIPWVRHIERLPRAADLVDPDHGGECRRCAAPGANTADFCFCCRRLWWCWLRRPWLPLFFELELHQGCTRGSSRFVVTPSLHFTTPLPPSSPPRSKTRPL